MTELARKLGNVRRVAEEECVAREKELRLQLSGQERAARLRHAYELSELEHAVLVYMQGAKESTQIISLTQKMRVEGSHAGYEDCPIKTRNARGEQNIREYGNLSNGKLAGRNRLSVRLQSSKRMPSITSPVLFLPDVPPPLPLISAKPARILEAAARKDVLLELGDPSSTRIVTIGMPVAFHDIYAPPKALPVVRQGARRSSWW
ncbi:hypothetical protein T492DRAFT_955546 [Pavlovales sp. CCMP2436]|nr:hypothetical protein T492DRAFT_955546 [Pavlovales sp. CCMP2436]